MNIHKKQIRLWLFGLIAFAAAGCGETELVTTGLLPDDSDPLANDPTRREVALGFRNKLNIAPIGTTRADAPIATTEENHIATLDVYVFSSDKEEGPYTYQERFCYREDGSAVVAPNQDVTKIQLKADAGTVAEATLRPKKGLYTKFYCIANQPSLLKDAAAFDGFTPLEQSAPGTGNNVVTKAGVPTEADFLAFTTPLLKGYLDPAATQEADILMTPLPMVGSYSPALDLRDISMGSRTRINMTLSRIVSRFDIDNDKEKSHLEITAVSMGKGRKGVTLFPVVPVEDAADPTNTLITYMDRPFTGANINAGIQTGAFYSYPSPVEDEGYLIIKGKYALNQTDVPQEVSYKVDFTQQVAGTGGFIDVKANHRYTVRITDADPFKLNVEITIADWTDGEDIDYQPENELTVKAVAAETGSTYDEPTRTATVDVTKTEFFTVSAETNSEVEAGLLYTGVTGGNANWLETEVTKVVTRSGSSTYTCKVKKNALYNGVLFPKATLTLRSKAGREESQFAIVPTLAAPTVTLKGTPADVTYSVGALEIDKTVTTFTLTVAAPNGGSKLTGTLPAWLTVDVKENKTTASADYVFTVTNTAAGFPNTFPAEDCATFELKNYSDDTKETTIKVKMTDKTAAP